MGKNNRRRNHRDDSSRSDASNSSANDDLRVMVASTASLFSASPAANEYQKQSSSSRKRNKDNNNTTTHNNNNNNNNHTDNNGPNSNSNNPRGVGGNGRNKTFYQWCLQEQQGIIWVWGCILLGGFFGFGVGSGVMMREYGRPPSTWRINLGGKIRSNFFYRNTIGKLPSVIQTNTGGASAGGAAGAGATSESDDDDASIPFWEKEHIKFVVDLTNSVLGSIPGISTLHNNYYHNNYYYHNHEVPRSTNTNDPFASNHGGAPIVVVRNVDSSELKSNPSHPYVYAVLREAIAREKGGYVHPDLGIMEPAPSGAARGIGMVRNLYHQCQTRCNPGLAQEKLEAKQKNNNNNNNSSSNTVLLHRQKDIHPCLVFCVCRPCSMID